MNFVKFLVAFFINPVNLFFLLGLLAGFFYFKSKFLWFKRTVVFTAILYLLTASSPLPDFILESLENNYQPFSAEINFVAENTIDILVLGSGHTADPDLPATSQLSSSALARLTEGIRIYEGLGGRLILSGYGDESSVSQAEILCEAAISLGIPATDIQIQPEPSNTAEEAFYYQQKFAGMDHPLILVTSAAHMPRAMYLFEKAGLHPVAAPTDFLVKDDPSEGYEFGLFSPRNFLKVQSALHEYIGMLWARMGSG